MVIKALQPLDKTRKCFRQIGDVLVERTVGEVLPAVRSNRDQLAEVRCNTSRTSSAVLSFKTCLLHRLMLLACLSF